MIKTPATRQLILEAAVTCIEKYGLGNVTTRRIATEAGTNIASINYHFRSKGDLMAEVMSMTINHMLEDVIAAMNSAGEPFNVTLTNVLFYLLDGCLRFPGISRAQLNEAVTKAKQDSASGRALSKVFEGLVRKAAQAYPRHSEERVRLRLSQIMSSIAFTILNPGLFQVPREFSLTNSKRARALAESYTSLFIKSI